MMVDNAGDGLMNVLEGMSNKQTDLLRLDHAVVRIMAIVYATWESTLVLPLFSPSAYYGRQPCLFPLPFIHYEKEGGHSPGRQCRYLNT